MKDRKQRLFAEVFARLPKGVEATVVEVGLGTFPNASYYFDGEVKSGSIEEFGPGWGGPE